MTEEKLQTNGKEFAKDVRAGMDTASLMKKYKLSHQVVQNAVKRLSDFDQRTGLSKEKETPPTSVPPHGINKWKIVALTGLTWLGFSVLAKLYVIGVRQPVNPQYSMVDAYAVIWGWACLSMGIYLAYKLRKWTEVLFGILFFVLATLPFFGALFGIGYFAWAYVKLERLRLAKAESQYNRTDSS